MTVIRGWMTLTAFLSCLVPLPAHEPSGHRAATYEVTAAAAVTGRRLQLTVTDADGGGRLAARFSLRLGGAAYAPPSLGPHGLRFVSIHQGKAQRFVALYARGSGAVEIPLPADARAGTITVARGFEYLPATVSFASSDEVTKVAVALSRWSDLAARGWRAADEHLHYERTTRAHDRDWLTMMDADDLTDAHFLVLKGGNLPGVWAAQFAYGRDGEGSDGLRLIRPGEEYRDRSQGHVNLLGVNEVIPPISTGGIGRPPVAFNYPPLIDVFHRTHEREGIGGPAHGASLAISSTAVLDTVLGGVDFIEIANTHLTKTDVWYELLSAGYLLPPLAGTDLPNFPFRDDWQPFLGEIRTYVRVGERRGFAAWVDAVRRNETFVTSGPLIELSVNDAGPGGTVHLPAGGGEVAVVVKLSSPRPLKSLEIVRQGDVLPLEIERRFADGVNRWRVSQRIAVAESCWLAARGAGETKPALQQQTGIEQPAFAHTAAVRVLVDQQPIRSTAALQSLIEQLARQREYYRSEATYEQAAHRLRFVALFDEAIERLQSRLDGSQ